MKCIVPSAASGSANVQSSRIFLFWLSQPESGVKFIPRSGQNARAHQYQTPIFILKMSFTVWTIDEIIAVIALDCT